jgi:hypothetical protein
MAFFRRGRPESVPTAPAFALGSVRLYQTDAELSVRLPSGAGSIAPYMQALVATGDRVLAAADQRLPDMGVLIVVGVRAPNLIHLWCEPVGGELPADAWTHFKDELAVSGRELRPAVAGDVAFALEGVVGAGPSIPFPQVPQAWVDAIKDANEPVTVPDGVFDRIFPV